MKSRVLLFAAILFLVLSIIMAVVSLFPVTTGESEPSVWINDTFTLSQNEVRRQGLGSLHGGENTTVIVRGDNFVKNFSIVTYNGLRFANYTQKDINFTFTAGADYYEAVFYTQSPDAGKVHFQMSVLEPKVLYPFFWLNHYAKVIFCGSLVLVTVLTLKFAFLERAKTYASNLSPPTLSQKNRKSLLVLLSLSLVLWFLLLAVNSNPLASFENWYTDHARHSYVASLFTKTGFSIFNSPLGSLASNDGSYYKFVTWPEMPHLYPLGSVFLFLPFGALLQNGFDAVMIFKLEIALFLVLSHVCLYFFLKHYLKKDISFGLKLLGVYIIYVPLVIYSANGMFDAVAFLFSLFSLTAFMVGKYDYFLLLVGISVLFKYQAAIFLFPLIILGLLIYLKDKGISGLLRNKLVILGAVFAVISGATAFLSAPFLLQTRPELVMNGINAFAPNAQLPWALQSFSVLLTLGVTLAFAVYMLNKNSLLSLSALFMLLPSFTLPYFQNWYLPFIFVYVLIPQSKKEIQLTMVWLIFMVAVLSFGGIAYNPLAIFENLRSMLRI